MAGATVRAKFRVDEIKSNIGYEGQEIRTIAMSPVYSDDPESENRHFWEASPNGSVDLRCINLAAAEAFKLGGEYYLDFTPAEES